MKSQMTWNRAQRERRQQVDGTEKALKACLRRLPEEIVVRVITQEWSTPGRLKSLVEKWIQIHPEG